MPETTREWRQVRSVIDGQEYVAQYSAGGNQTIDLLVVAQLTKQTYRLEPYAGWQPIGWPEYTHDLIPMKLRAGAFVDMRDDPDFAQIVKAA